MSNINIDVLLTPVRVVLLQASQGKGKHPQSLTSYQIADRLSHTEPELFKALEAEKGVSGPGSMFNLISKVGVALATMNEVSISYMDAGGLEFKVGGGMVNPAYEVIALYRLV